MCQTTSSSSGPSSASSSASVTVKRSIPTITLDKSQTTRTWAHYFAVWVWVGSIFWYLVFLVSLPFFHETSAWRTWAAVLVVATLVPCDERLQPQICVDFGRWVIRRAVEYFHIKMIVLDAEAVRCALVCIYNIICNIYRFIIITSAPFFVQVRACGPAIVAMEPHDVLPLSICGFSNDFQGLPGHTCVACVTSFCFKLPVMKHIYTWVGATAVEKVPSAVRIGILVFKPLTHHPSCPPALLCVFRPTLCRTCAAECRPSSAPAGFKK